MKFFEKKLVENYIGCWEEYYLFGRKVYTKLVCLYKY